MFGAGQRPRCCQVQTIAGEHQLTDGRPVNSLRIVVLVATVGTPISFISRRRARIGLAARVTNLQLRPFVGTMTTLRRAVTT